MARIFCFLAVIIGSACEYILVWYRSNYKQKTDEIVRRFFFLFFGIKNNDKVFENIMYCLHVIGFFKWIKSADVSYALDIDGLVQERLNCIAKAGELRLSCTNASIYDNKRDCRRYRLYWFSVFGIFNHCW